MKLYRVSVATSRELDVKSDFRSVTWVGSQADAGKTRKALVDNGIKRAEITTEEVDVPTNKEGLLKFLNERGE